MGQSPNKITGIIRCRAGVGEQGRHSGDGKPAGPDRPLEKGVRGIEIGHQMPGRSWRAGKASGDGKPAGPDRPLEKGVRGIEIGHQMPGRSWRAGKASGDGKPAGPDRPLENGVGGIKQEACPSG